MSSLMQIPEMEKSHELFSYIKTINRIIDYHQTHLHPALIQCNGNILKIYNVFRMSLKNKEFVEVYRLYAHFACRDIVTFATRNCRRKFKNIPLKHLLHYQTFLERLIFRAYHKNRNEFVALVATTNRFAEFLFNFYDNWCLYSFKVTAKVIIRFSYVCYVVLIFHRVDFAKKESFTRVWICWRFGVHCDRWMRASSAVASTRYYMCKN